MLLRLEEVAARLGISYTAARLLVLSSGEMTYLKVGARGIRVEESEVERYIAEHQHQQVATAKEEKGGTG